MKTTDDPAGDPLVKPWIDTIRAAAAGQRILVGAAGMTEDDFFCWLVNVAFAFVLVSAIDYDRRILSFPSGGTIHVKSKAEVIQRIEEHKT
jgi:hypothetical protein